MSDIIMHIPELEDYFIVVEPSGRRKDGTLYRETVTVVETKDGVRTGRIWPEPFDPEKGDVDELEARFRARIKSGDPPPVTLHVPGEEEPAVPEVALVKVDPESVAEVILPVVERLVQEFVREIRKQGEVTIDSVNKSKIDLTYSVDTLCNKVEASAKTHASRLDAMGDKIAQAAVDIAAKEDERMGAMVQSRLDNFLPVLSTDLRREVALVTAREVHAAMEAVIPKVGRVAYTVASDAAAMAAEETARERSWGTRLRKIFRRK